MFINDLLEKVLSCCYMTELKQPCLPTAGFSSEFGEFFSLSKLNIVWKLPNKQGNLLLKCLDCFNFKILKPSWVKKIPRTTVANLVFFLIALFRSLLTCSTSTTNHPCGLNTRRRLQCSWLQCTLLQHTHLLPSRCSVITSCHKPHLSSSCRTLLCRPGQRWKVRASRQWSVKSRRKKASRPFNWAIWWSVYVLEPNKTVLWLLTSGLLLAQSLLIPLLYSMQQYSTKSSKKSLMHCNCIPLFSCTVFKEMIWGYWPA